jgi:hypothetical protein
LVETIAGAVKDHYHGAGNHFVERRQTMNRVALPSPVLPGKDARAIAELLNSRPDQYVESRRRQGITLERAYLQTTPMGSFVVAYIESEGSFADVNAALLQSDLDIDREFLRLLSEIHGFNPAEASAGPVPETIGEWIDPDVARPLRGMGFCVPVTPGASAKGREFCYEAFTTRKDELAASRRALGGCAENVTLISTPQGDVTGIYIEAKDPVEANRRFAASSEPFDVWFKEQLKTLYPPFIDFNEPVPGVTEIFDSEKLLARA